MKNYIDCILAERKQDKQEDFLNPIDKGDIPLDTYHVDHLGPLPSIKKNCRYILLVIDTFSKFIWLYPTKSADASDVINRLCKQSVIFGNPQRIISDRNAAFTSNAFEEHCNDKKI